MQNKNSKDISKQVFGDLMVLCFDSVRNKKEYWKCVCICGKEKVVRKALLFNGNTQSCGCYKLKRIAETRRAERKDLAGQVFNRLTVTKFSHLNNGKIFYNCKCECGNLVTVNSNSLKRGITKSCGCWLKEKAQLTGKITTAAFKRAKQFGISRTDAFQHEKLLADLEESGALSTESENNNE